MVNSGLRAVVLSILAIGSIAVATWSSDWFRLTLDTPLENAERIDVRFGLRSVTICNAPSQAVCVTITDAAVASNPLMPETSRAWARERLLEPFHPAPLSATIALWATTAFAAFVLLQIGIRLSGRAAPSFVSMLGYVVGVCALFAILAFAFALAPDAEFYARELPRGFALTVDRTYAPALAIVGVIAGVFALHYAAATESYDALPAKAPLPAARVVADPPPPAAPRRDVPDSIPLETEPPPATAAPVVRRSHAPTAQQPLDDRAHQLASALRGKLQFAMHSAELGPAGIDARREDGTNVLVLWRDVVGLVVRRAPPDYEGVPIVDIVSTTGSTLRLVPWTRLAGEPIAGDGDDRVRAFVALVTRSCPTLHVDRATAEFVDRRGPALQLPDLELLAAHDARMA